MGDPGLIPGSGRSPGEGNGNPLQYSCLENPMDRGAWWATVHGVAKSRTWLRDFAFTLTFQCTIHQVVPVVKNPPVNAGDLRDRVWSQYGEYHLEENENPIQYSCLKNPMDRGTGGLQSMRSQSWTQLKRLSSSAQFSDFWNVSKTFCNL